MSTLRVNNLQNTSTTDGGISINNSGHVTVDGVAMPSAGPLSNRNLIDNGAMQVAQRGTQVTGVTSSGFQTCDRFYINLSSLGTWTVDQSTDSPNGFSNSFKLTCTTADASPAAGDSLVLYHTIEAQNLQSLGFGTADAKSLILSFWVKSNKTGSGTVVLQQSDNSSKMISPSYSISSADTWEYKTISVPADTAGVIDNDNGGGLRLEWWLNGGSTFSSGSNRTTWTTFTQADRNASNLGVGGATSDYFAITGVQLEVGSVATPFEHRSYGDELARCQRYYISLVKGNNQVFPGVYFYWATTELDIPMGLPVAMRATPTIEQVTGSSYYRASPQNDNFDGFSGVQYASPGGAPTSINLFAASAQNVSGSTGAVGYVHTVNSNASVAFSAEL